MQRAPCGGLAVQFIPTGAFCVARSMTCRYMGSLVVGLFATSGLLSGERAKWSPLDRESTLRAIFQADEVAIGIVECHQAAHRNVIGLLIEPVPARRQLLSNRWC